MGEGLEKSVNETKSSRAATTTTIINKSPEVPLLNVTQPKLHDSDSDDRVKLPPKQPQPDVKLQPKQPQLAAVTTTTATTTPSTTPVVVNYRYQPGIYRFRCYGKLEIRQERPLRANQRKDQPPLDTSSHMVCRGFASRLQLIEPFVHVESAKEQFFHNPERLHDDQPAADEEPMKLAYLQHPDDLVTFIEDQRAFVWTPHSTTNDTTSTNNSDKTTTTTTNTTSNTRNQAWNVWNQFSSNKVWNQWISMGITEVDLLVLRKEETLLPDQGSLLMRKWFMHTTKKPKPKQQSPPIPPPTRDDPSKILGVLPKSVLGFGQHVAGIYKDGAIYYGSYWQTSFMNVLQISLYRMGETRVPARLRGTNDNDNNKTTTTTSVTEPARLDTKARALQVQAFWKKVLVNMKREVLFFKSELSGDFGERWYKMSSLILEKLPRLAGKITHTMVKIIRGTWKPGDE
jgi:hypothetical protein